MRATTSRAVPALIGFFLFPLAAQGAGLEVHYKMTQKKEPAAAATEAMESRYYIVPGHVRFENWPSGKPEMMTAVIGQASPRKAYVLMPGQDRCMEVTETSMKDAQKTVKSNLVSDQPFKPTGVARAIAGHRCKELERKLSDRRETICVSQDLKAHFKQMEAAFPVSEESQSYMPKGVDGFPLAYGYTTSSKPSETFSMEATLVRSAEIPASKFEPGRNCQSMEDLQARMPSGKDMEEAQRMMKKMMEENAKAK